MGEKKQSCLHWNEGGFKKNLITRPTFWVQTESLQSNMFFIAQHSIVNFLKYLFWNHLIIFQITKGHSATSYKNALLAVKCPRTELTEYFDFFVYCEHGLIKVLGTISRVNQKNNKKNKFKKNTGLCILSSF